MPCSITPRVIEHQASRNCFVRRTSSALMHIGVAKFMKSFLQTGSIHRCPGSGWPSKVTAEIKEIVEQQMHLDDETTAYQLNLHVYVLHLKLNFK